MIIIHCVLITEGPKFPTLLHAVLVHTGDIYYGEFLTGSAIL